jgi:hypothetical protein
VNTSPANTTAPARLAPGTSSTVPIQTNGPRTVLSPIGLNVRTEPSKTSAVAGTAGQGAVLTVIGHTDQAGGWYQVKGATVTGFITDNPTLSANGRFAAYGSDQHYVSLLYPEKWSSTEVPPASVAFRPPTGGDSINVTTAATTAQLARGRAGYRQDSSSVLVVCGVTGDLVTFAQVNFSSPNSAPPSSKPPPSTAAPATERYLVQLHLTLDGQHALAVDANLADLADLQTVKDVAHSISFPFPQCEQGASPPDSSTSAP